MRTRGLCPLALLVGLVLPLFGISAQSVRGTVVNERSAPVPGVIVLLLDDASNVVARTLSGGSGEFRLLASRAGSYRTRTLRIGFRPMLSATFQLAAAQEIMQRLTLSSVQFTLDTVKVLGRNECRVTSESAAATFAVWEQVQAALTAAQITSDRGGLNTTTITYERTLDRSGRRVLGQSTAMHVSNVRRIWRARAVDSLHALGYVTRDADGGSNYFAPDLETLLAPLFLEDHCFRLTTSRSKAEVGIAFEPTPTRKDLPEIEGTMWLDRATSALRRLEFRYVNVSPEENAEARGELEFVPAKNGAWAISRWSIRMPELSRTERRQSMGGTQTQVHQIKVGGGELVLLRSGSDTLWASAPLQLAGVVKDSTSGAVVAGARVSLAGTALEARTDAGGRFTIAGVLPGEYTMETHTPSLDSLNAVHQLPVSFTPTSEPATIRLASPATLVRSLCGPRPLSEPGIILGRIISVRDTMPFHTLRVHAEWFDNTIGERAGSVATNRPARVIEASVDSRGEFRLCGIPLNVDIVLRAESDSAERARVGRARRSAPVQLQIPPSVRVSNAELRVEPARTLGTVDTGEMLGDSALAPLPTTEAARADAVNDSFEAHRRIGLGVFLVRSELENSKARALANVLVRIPGLRMVRGAASHAWPMSSSMVPASADRIYRPESSLELDQGMKPGCYARVYVDGLLMNPGAPTPGFDVNVFDPSGVGALEYYASAGVTPARYSGSQSGCGVLVIWTRRGPGKS